jgi:hypothetical protein
MRSFLAIKMWCILLEISGEIFRLPARRALASVKRLNSNLQCSNCGCDARSSTTQMLTSERSQGHPARTVVLELLWVIVPISGLSRYVQRKVTYFKLKTDQRLRSALHHRLAENGGDKRWE